MQFMFIYSTKRTNFKKQFHETRATMHNIISDIVTYYNVCIYGGIYTDITLPNIYQINAGLNLIFIYVQYILYTHI